MWHERLHSSTWMGPSQWTWIARLLKAVESLVGLALMSLYFLISILPLYYYFQ